MTTAAAAVVVVAVLAVLAFPAVVVPVVVPVTEFPEFPEVAEPVYRTIALGPPQISCALPAQAMLHCPEMREVEARFDKLLPQ